MTVRTAELNSRSVTNEVAEAMERVESSIARADAVLVTAEVVEDTQTDEVAPESVEEPEVTTDTPDESESPLEGTTSLPRPAGNASGDAWREYRLDNGYTEEELDGLGRNDLRDLEDR